MSSAKARANEGLSERDVEPLAARRVGAVRTRRGQPCCCPDSSAISYCVRVRVGEFVVEGREPLPWVVTSVQVWGTVVQLYMYTHLGSTLLFQTRSFTSQTAVGVYIPRSDIQT